MRVTKALAVLPAAGFALACLAQEGPRSPGKAEWAFRFATPQAEYSPVPIWWWSGDKIEREGIRKQIKAIADGGMYNAIVLNLAPSGPLYGSAQDDPPFLSEEWWQLFAYTVSVGKKEGVGIWFYDQLGFSGAGLQARVVRDNPEFRGVSLQRAVKDVEGPAEVELFTPAGATPLAAFTAERIPHAGTTTNSIWDKGAAEGEVRRYFRRTFTLEEVPPDAHINISCDNGYVVYVNGVKIGQERYYETAGWKNAERFHVGPQLRQGRNLLGIEAENLGGPGGLAVELSIGKQDPQIILSDEHFRMNDRAERGWLDETFDDSGWSNADVLGEAGLLSPWGDVAGLEFKADLSFGTLLQKAVDVSERMKDGALRASVPEGPHRVELFYTVPGGFDYLNPRAGAALIDVVHGEMERRFADELGRSIVGSFQDEFPAVPRFSILLPKEFRERAGYDLLDKLPALFDDVVDWEDPTTVQIRCDASAVAAQMAEEAFFIPLYDWHEKHGMLCGYDQVIRNADPVGGDRYYVDYFKTMRHYSAPGNDMDGARSHQSIADLYKRPRVWMEGFHSSGWGQTLEEIATLLHPWIAQGSNLFNPHAIYYSVHGSYYEWAPPDTGWRQPYYTHYRQFADYVSRLCMVLSQGTRFVEVGILYPSNTVHAGQGFAQASPMVQSAAECYWEVQRLLEAENVECLIVDEDSLAKAEIENGVLTISEMDLRVMILPSTQVVTDKTMEVLAEFADAGGTVLIVGDPPKWSADGTADTFAAHARDLDRGSVRVQQASETVAQVLEAVERDVQKGVPATHRSIDGRDFYFLLSDPGTPANGQARYAINHRELWETKAARGECLKASLKVSGVPELWDAYSGQIRPIYDYRRTENGTELEVDLESSPAPLVELRTPKPEDPISVESDLNVKEVRRDGHTLTVLGLPRLDSKSTTMTEHYARVTYEDAVFEGKCEAPEIKRIDIPGPFDCELIPTCDNSDGSFAWPPSKGPIPVEVRSFRYHEERKSDDAAEWTARDFDDSQWETVIASFGPRAEVAGPLNLEAGVTFDTVDSIPSDAGPFREAVYSTRLGIDEDRMFSAALGGKGRIPEEFIDLGHVHEGELYVVRTTITLPAGNGNPPATLRVGSAARKRAFLNGKEVLFAGNPSARVVRAEVELVCGDNQLDLLLSPQGDSRVRLYYHLLPSGSIPPDPEWIWGHAPNGTGKVLFSKVVEIPAKIRSASMVVALGGLHRIRVNGRLLADQGNFDAYFMSRAEAYDISGLLNTGNNKIEIEAHDPGHPVGLLVDGLVALEDEREVPFVSDASFVTGGGSACRVLAGPAHGYMGDPATLLLRPRPHPLPLGGWLLNQPSPPTPFEKLVYSVPRSDLFPGWYRFRVPPGAFRMRLRTHGEVRLFVNGEELGAETHGTHGVYDLPGREEAERIASVRIVPVRGFEKGAALPEPIAFDMGPGRIPLGSWDALGLPHYSGGMLYRTDLDVPQVTSAQWILDLGRVRGSADVSVNGHACGVRIWHPYRFDITEALNPGTNRIDVRVFNTLGPHFAIGHPSAHVFPNQTLSGIFGPISVKVREPVGIRMVKVRRR